MDTYIRFSFLWTSSFILALLNPVFSQAQISFQEASNTPFENVYQSSIAFSDIDMDGDLDLLISGRTSGSQRVSELYKNDGNGNFILFDSTLSGASGSSVAFADIDLDNDEDLLITGQNSGSPLVLISKLYRNDGLGGFTEITGSGLEAVQNSSVAFADVDNNGTQDLVITGDGGGTNYVANLYLNDSLGNFSESPGAFNKGLRYSAIAFAHVNTDMNVDLVMTGLAFLNPGSENYSGLFLNDGNGNFTESMGQGLIDASYSSVAFADVDSDGDQDLFIAGNSGGSGKSANLYFNDGNGNFTLSSSMFAEVNKSSHSFADVDNDSDMDLVLCGESSPSGKITKLYLNDGLGNFQEETSVIFPGISDGSVAFADVNNDQLPDLMICGENSGTTFISKLYINTSNISAIEMDEVSPIKFYPNPAYDFLIIENESQDENTLLELFDLQGKRYRKQVFTGGRTKVEVEELIPGFYLLKMTQNNEIYNHKILIK